jgi:hypothetical protein
MRSVSTFLILAASLVFTVNGFAQSQQYQRPQAKKVETQAPQATDTKKAAPAPTSSGDSDKLDISDLEQKYWAPKDTDFSVVQNRIYTKEKRFAVTLGLGPVVNDPYNEGLNYALQVNYYRNEREGFEFTYIGSQLKDSNATNVFRTALSGGGVSPDFNRAAHYYGIGYNWVPFYAKMSFLNRRILYLDLQITPHIGYSVYEQQLQNQSGKEKGSLTYGVDITQYFFLHRNYAVRFNLHNRWSNQEYLKYTDGIKVRDDLEHVTMFIVGFTYFL